MTDSQFTSATDNLYPAETWADLRLIHVSEAGWCAVYSGLYRGRRIAIKALKPEFQESELHRSLLQKEFEVTSAFNHQNIVSTMRLENVPGIGMALLMEYVDGTTLSEYLASNPTLSKKQIADIINQICSAVGYIHSRQTIHCDLKPSNIMITPTGYVKIIDFGMSRGNGFERLDFPGGTQGFTAPENFESESVASPSVDIYSIGKILQMLDTQKRFKRVWMKCLSGDPEKRPRSANEIPKLLAQTEIRKKQKRLLYSSIAVIGISIVVVGTYLLLQPKYAANTPKETSSMDISKQTIGLKDLMLEVMNENDISDENREIIDDMAFRLNRVGYECGERLISAAINGEIKGADNAQWADIKYHLFIWQDETYQRTQSTVGIAIFPHKAKNRGEIRLYIVNESQDTTQHDLMMETLGLHPGEKKADNYWWFAPKDESLHLLSYTTYPDYTALQTKIETLLSRLNN